MELDIIRRADEPRKKCTAMLLAGHPRVRLFHFPRLEGFAPEGAWVLAVGGPPLDAQLEREPRPQRLVLVDTLWVKAEQLLGCLPAMPRVSLPEGWVTAYPRRSKLGRDPEGGLATNEAAFIAALVAGSYDPSLLGGYRWADEFFARNQELIDRQRMRSEESRTPPP